MSLLDDMRQHLAKTLGQVPPCSVCKNEEWDVAGTASVAVAAEVAAGIPVKTNPTTIPVAVLICKRCFHVLHFALNPIIQEKQEKERQLRGDAMLRALRKLSGEDG